MPERTVRPSITTAQLRALANGERAWASPVEFPCKNKVGERHVVGILLDVKEQGHVERLDIPLTRLFPAWSRMTVPARFKSVREKLEEAESAVEWLEGRINHEPDDSLHVGKMILTLSSMNMVAGELWSALVRLGDQDPVLSVQLVEMTLERRAGGGRE